MESYQKQNDPGTMILLQADVDYEGPYDILTGLPVQDAETVVQEASVSDSSSYDYASKMFRFPVEGTSDSVYASVAANMVTTQAVTIQADAQVDVALYRNGERLDTDFSEPVKVPGKYDLIVEQVDNEFQLFSFTIVGEKTGLLNNYQMPSGFYLTELILDDEPQQILQAGIVDLTAEGTYEITYKCSATNADYHLDIVVDHTPPEIVCEGITNGYASGPVTVTGIEKTDTVSLLFNGESVKLPANDTLVSPGNYQLTVTDDAGNAVQQDFTIRMYLNSQGLIFSIIALVLVAALVIYVYVIRKRLRVQ